MQKAAYHTRLFLFQFCENTLGELFKITILNKGGNAPEPDAQKRSLQKYERGRKLRPLYGCLLAGDYSRLPKNCNKNMNKFTKSRYSCNAPKIADFSNQAASPCWACAMYVVLMFCVSYAVRPAKIKTPKAEIAKWMAGDPRK